jgi:hypothetical protein
MKKKEEETTMSEIVKVNLLTEAIVAVCGAADKHPTLKSVAEALGVPQQRLYSVAKQPVEGKEYNAKEFNWDAIERFCARRLEGKFEDFNALVTKAVEIDAELATADGRKAHRTPGSVKTTDIVLADGSVIPSRKYPLENGQTVMMKSDKKPIQYTVAMQTETHIVLQEIGTPCLTSYSNWTLNQKIIVNPEAMAKEMASRQAAIDAVKVTPAAE